jgi:Holliday junction resolvase RusA-like endonuclease
MSIPMEPKAKARPRFYRGRAYTSKSTREYMKQAIVHLDSQIAIHDTPVRLDIEYIHKRPNRLNRKKDPDSRIWKTTKPDIDNLNKMVMDILTRAGTMADDNLVTEINSTQYYAGKLEQHKTTIKIFIWRSKT